MLTRKPKRSAVLQRIQSQYERAYDKWRYRQLAFFFETQVNKTHREILMPVLTRLDHNDGMTDEKFKHWKIIKIDGGTTNNRLYRISNNLDGYIVKCFQSNRRALREFGALFVNHLIGSRIAPVPILYSCRISRPMVVQSWVQGDTSYTIPADESAWLNLIYHYVVLHQITPEKVNIKLPAAIINARNKFDCEKLIHREFSAIPRTKFTREFDNFLKYLNNLPLPEEPKARICLCKGDGNLRNFIRRPRFWMSVDWEASGWGDPCFDIAFLLSHPTLLPIQERRRQWFVEQYSKLMDDSSVIPRINYYFKYLVAWWIPRYTRMILNNSDRLDKRQRDLNSQKSYIKLAREFLQKT